MTLSTESPSSTGAAATTAALAPLLDHLSEGVLIIDHAGDVVHINRAGMALLAPGFPATETSARARVLWRAHIAGTEQPYPTARLPIAAALAGTAATVGDLEMWRATDRIVLEVSACPLVDAFGARAGAMVTLLDITASARLRHAERELHEARTRFEVAQEKAPMGLALVGLDERFTDVNASLCRLSGRTRDELVGSRMVDLVDPETTGQYRALTDALLADGADDYRETVAMTRDDGEVISAELTVGLIRDDVGRPVNQLLLVQDVTDRIRHARVIDELNGNLEQRGRALQQLNAELLRSNRDLEQFAYVASHDLSEPLRSVTGYVQLLARRYQGRLDADADQFIAFAVDGVTRMQALIHDLLAYSRAGVRGENVSVDCEALVASVVAVAREAHPDAVFEVGPMPTVTCASSLIRQVFENLVSNAIKFVPPERTPRVVLSAQSLATEWKFTVADNGIGIEDRHVERVFGMFQRLHARSDYPGTGIGLAICQRIIDSLGGVITVHTELGAGSRFSFTIPRPSEDTP